MIGTFIFLFVLICTMTKEEIGDFGRYPQDEINDNRLILNIKVVLGKKQKVGL